MKLVYGLGLAAGLVGRARCSLGCGREMDFVRERRLSERRSLTFVFILFDRLWNEMNRAGRFPERCFPESK